MSITEKQLQEGAQAVMQGLEGIAAESVVINDWTVLDRPMVMSPFVIIENSDDFTGMQDTVSPETTYTLRFWLLVGLGNTDWKTASDTFRDTRQAILDGFNAVGTARSLGGLDGTNARRLVSLTPIGNLYPPDIDPEIVHNATPDYIAQYLGLEVDLF